MQMEMETSATRRWSPQARRKSARVIQLAYTVHIGRSLVHTLETPSEIFPNYPRYPLRMKRLGLLLFLIAMSAVAQQDATQLTIAVDPRGDTEQGVVAHVTFRLPPNLDAPPETTLLLQGSFLEGG